MSKMADSFFLHDMDIMRRFGAKCTGDPHWRHMVNLLAQAVAESNEVPEKYETYFGQGIDGEYAGRNPRQLRCTAVEKLDGSMMFHTGGVYTIRNPYNRSVEVTDDIGHTRVLVVEDGFARFIIGHTKFAGGHEEAMYAHFEEVEKAA